MKTGDDLRSCSRAYRAEASASNDDTAYMPSERRKDGMQRSRAEALQIKTSSRSARHKWLQRRDHGG